MLFSLLKLLIMKKILFFCDANNFPVGAFKFVKTLNLSEPILLTGAFFHSINYDVLSPVPLAISPDTVIAFTDADLKGVAKSIDQFKERCLLAGIEYRVHEESDVFKFKDAVKESRFADLIVMSEELFCSHIDKKQPNHYMHNVLHKAECPVVLIPEDYNAITRIAIAYDGSGESMFAIKKFCDLLPGYTKLPVDIFYWVNKTDDEIPDLTYLEEFVGRHFTNADFREVFFDPSEYISQWIKGKQDTMLVCGAYSRSTLSTLIKKSFVEEIITSHAVPVFVAHS
jgi:nucleotide-binding universal stress UspA family protein